MEITTINTELVAKMFLAGAKNLDAKKEWINELNVFPVPDGDTGTNMSMTIMSAAREVSALEKPEMKALAKAISSGSLRGARGNSGVILSQLFRGFTKVIAEYDEINVQILSDSFQKAVETAYKAVMKPKEGTILTVAKGMSDRALELCDDTEDLVYFCEEVIKEGDRRDRIPGVVVDACRVHGAAVDGESADPDGSISVPRRARTERVRANTCRKRECLVKRGEGSQAFGCPVL